MRARSMHKLHPKWLGLVLCLLMLGCDGGIFGTGDGTDPDVLLPGSTTSDTEGGLGVPGVEMPAEPSPGPDQVTPEPSTPPASPISPATGDALIEFNAGQDALISNTSLIGYANAYVVDANADALIQFINVTDTPISVFTNQSDSAIAVATTSGQQVFDTGNLPEDTTALYLDAIDDEGGRTNLVSIEPADLPKGSSTLIILRSLAPTADLIVVPSVSNNLAPQSGQIGIRIITAALIGDPETPSVFSFGFNLDGSIEPLPTMITSDALTYAMPVSNYIVLDEGQYTISDSAGRYNELTIELTPAGSLFTLILDPALPNQHLLLNE